MKPWEQSNKNEDEQHWEAGEQAGDRRPEAVAGEFEEKFSKAEAVQEAAELRTDLGRINEQIAQLNRKLEAAKKAPLSTQETQERDAKVARAIAEAEKSGSHPEISQRIGQVTGEQFVENLRNAQIADSPQGRELERLKNRQFDITTRLSQLETGS